MEQIRALNCFLCNNAVPNGLNGLSTHFRTYHLLNITRRLPDTGFTCAQDGCQRNFIDFFSLRRHIRNNHLNHEANPENFLADANEINDDVQIEVPLQINLGNQILAIGPNQNEEPAALQAEPEAGQENINLVTSAARMIARFQSKSMTDTTLSNVVEEFEKFHQSHRSLLKSKIVAQLRADLIDDVIINNIIELFDTEDNPFKKVRTMEERIDILRNNNGYIEPHEIHLGKRPDTAFDRKKGCYVPVLVPENFQYVPIVDVLKLVLSNDEVRNAILSEKFSPEGILERSIDGQYFKTHPFFTRYKYAIRIKLYYDDFEIVNPIGSKTAIHKIGIFYYIIDNLPTHMNSELSSIHTLLICLHEDVKKYGFTKILAPFMSDLLKLESDEGIEMTIKDEVFILRATIWTLRGDGLAIHEVYNLLGPSANLFCRMCLFSRDDLHNSPQKVAPHRTREVYRQHIQELKRTNFSDATKTLTGLQGECCLNSSTYFNIADNKVFDIMHDFLCGIVPMVLKLVLHKYVQLDKFQIPHLNGVIHMFDYGYLEHKNKPSPNFTPGILSRKDHCLPQKAMQTWLLVRALPFLLSDRVEPDDIYMDLILYLLRIMELVFAPKMATSLLPYLHILTKDFVDLFKSLFPDVNLINKHHHIQHYAECISLFGPLVLNWCMRDEAKHNQYKETAQKIHNFKNPPKTLIRTGQCSQSSKWGGKDVKLYRVQVVSSRVKSVDHALCKDNLLQLGYTINDFIISPSKIFINGIEFSKNFYVVLKTASTTEDKSLVFGCIQEIVHLEDKEGKTFLLTSVYTSIIDPFMNAYRLNITNQPDKVFIAVSALPFYKTFCSWKNRISDDVYISLRHIII